MRGSGQVARLAAVAVVVLSALALVSLAARSGRTEPVTPAPSGSSAPPLVEVTSASYKQPDGGEVGQAEDTSGGQMPDALVWVLSLILLGLVAVGLALWATVFRPRVQLPALGGPQTSVGAAPVPDAVDAARLAAAVDAGLQELADGGPGEGVIACWVQLERAAAEAGTHRAQPDTPSELAGRLIDRHDVSSAPLLRLADLYREARYSRHPVTEAARAEARAALEQVQAELAAMPAGSPRGAPR